MKIRTLIHWNLLLKCGSHLVATFGLVGALAAQASCQHTIPPQPIAQITTSVRFAPLTKEIKSSRPNGGFILQQSTDTFTATFSPSEDMARNYTILHYYWSGIDIIGDADQPTVSGVLHNPGADTVVCAVELVANIPGAQPWTTDPWISKSVYVVGGPLSLGVYNGYPGTPGRDPGPTPYNPCYIEYFGFDPTRSKPDGAQDPQHGTVSAYGGQPTGTTYSWNVPSPLVILTPNVGPTTAALNVGATSGSGGSHARIVLTYTFDNADSTDRVTGTCIDNSAEQIDSDGTTIPDFFKFTAHKPSSLTQTHDSGTYNVVAGPPSWSCQRDYSYQLMDDGGKVMGYVWMAERWPSNWGNSAGYLWPPSSDGKFVDNFWISWAPAFPYNGGQGTAALGPFAHRYYAATTDTSYYQPGLSGILVKQTTTTFWTDFIVNP